MLTLVPIYTAARLNAGSWAAIISACTRSLPVMRYTSMSFGCVEENLLMPFPFWRTPSLEEQLQQLQAELRYFTPFIGGFPPRISSTNEAQRLVRRWQQAKERAERLIRRHPQALELRLAFADLLRMGHNMDMPGTAKACMDLLEDILRITPDHIRANYTLASLYVTLKPQFAPLAEAYFLKVERLVPPNSVPDIYQGLGFACLAQQKISQALTHLELYLQLRGNTPEIQAIVDNLKAGNTPQIITYE
jgi:tetratricopeptide (TPR) repeat protein